MTLMDRLAALSALDALAVLALVAAFGGISWRIEHPKPSNPSVSWMMAAYRRAWMLEMVKREPRIFDSQIMASLRQGTAFFASTALIAIGGVWRWLEILRRSPAWRRQSSSARCPRCCGSCVLRPC